MGVQPVCEAATTAAAVAPKQIIGPILGQVMDGIGIASVDDRCFADDKALACEQTVAMAFPCIGFLNFGSVFTATVHVKPDKDLIGKGL